MNWSIGQYVIVLTILCLFVGTSWSQVPFTCDGDIYLSIVNVNEQVEFYQLSENRSEVNFTSFSEVSPYNINAIGYRSTDNFIYGFSPLDHLLYRIDATGNIEELDYIVLQEDYFAGDITPNGKYLALFNGNSIAKINLDNYTLPPIYIPISKTDESQTLIASTDIAFNPATGILYGYDGVNGRLITIDHNTGLVDNSSKIRMGYNNTIPALFFNAVGELKGIATNNISQSAIFFQFDLETGSAIRSQTADIIGDRDACSCPYTLKMEAAFKQKKAFPCTSVNYTIKIANLRNELINNASLLVEFPSDFEIINVVNNPFGGNPNSNGSEILTLDNMTIPHGVDSLTVKIRIPEDANGTFAVQAALETINPLSEISEHVLSDNPFTFEKEDPSIIEIEPLAIGADLGYSEGIERCGNDTIFINFPDLAGLQYVWSTGDIGPHFQTTEAGLYSVEISSFCDQINYDIPVFDSYLSVDLGLDITKNFQEDLQLNPTIESSSTIESYQWEVDSGIPLICSTCPTLPLRATNDATYTLIITNSSGCVASDEITLFVDRPIYAPNAFTPNEDAINDVFYLHSSYPPVKLHSFTIFDRSGAIVHQSEGFTNDPNLGWNGKLNEQIAQQGVYIWTALLEYGEGKKVNLSGDVLLMR